MKYIVLIGHRESILLWEYKLICKIADKGHDILLILGRNNENRSLHSKFVLYYFFKFLDKVFYKLFISKPFFNPFEEISLSSLDLEKRYVKSKYENGREELEIDFSCKNSVVIRLGFGILGEKSIFKLGNNIYSLHHGDIEAYRGGPAGFWEFILGESLVKITLQKINHHLDAGEIIEIGCVPVNRVSFQGTLDLIYGKGLDLYLKHLNNDFLNNEVPYLNEEIDISVKGTINKRPSNRVFFPFLIRTYSRLVKDIFFKLLYETYWYTYVRPIPNVGLVCSFNSKYSLKPNRGSYLADPFILERNNEVYILVEEYLYKKNVGTISILNTDGEFIKRDIFKSDGHRSFPQVIYFDKKYFLLTESQALNTMQIYELSLENFSVKEIYSIENISLVDCAFISNNELVLLGCRRFSSIGFADDNHFGIRLIYDKGRITGYEELPVESDLPLWSRRPASSINKGKFMWFQYNLNFYGETLLKARISIKNNVIVIRRMGQPLSLRNSSMRRAHTHTLNTSENYLSYDQRIYRFRWIKYIL